LIPDPDPGRAPTLVETLPEEAVEAATTLLAGLIAKATTPHTATEASGDE
jgi:hypothetical protein